MTGNPRSITEGIEFLQTLLNLYNMKLEELKEQVEERDKVIYSNTIGKCKEISKDILSYLENVEYSLDDDDNNPETRNLLKLSPKNLVNRETE